MRQLRAIVMGASAGGVSALARILSALPADFPLPIAIVLHVPRDRPSQVAQVLGAQSALRVIEAEDKQALLPGQVSIAPPDYHLLVEDAHTLALSIDPPVLFSRPAIDVLFESAAAVFGEDLLAVLLTGASADGSDGVAAVRAAGGLAWIQSPEEAVASTMPASALAHAGADAVLGLDQMIERMQDFR